MFLITTELNFNVHFEFQFKVTIHVFDCSDLNKVSLIVITLSLLLNFDWL